MVRFLREYFRLVFNTGSGGMLIELLDFNWLVELKVLDFNWPVERMSTAVNSSR